METIITCPKCGGNSVVCNGYTVSNKTLYKCQECKKEFTNNLIGRPPTQNKICKICGNPSTAKSLCSKHYQQWYRKNKN